MKQTNRILLEARIRVSREWGFMNAEEARLFVERLRERLDYLAAPNTVTRSNVRRLVREILRQGTHGAFYTRPAIRSLSGRG